MRRRREFKETLMRALLQEMRMAAGICFIAAAATQEKKLLRCLFGAAGVCELVSSAGLFLVYWRHRED